MKAPALSRRGLVAGLAVAPLAALPAGAASISGISPELARLIRKSDRANARLTVNAAVEDWSPGPMRAASVLRLRVATFPSVCIADVLAKAVHIDGLWGEGGLQADFDAGSRDGGCYLDDMTLAVALDLSRIAGATLFPSA